MPHVRTKQLTTKRILIEIQRLVVFADDAGKSSSDKCTQERAREDLSRGALTTLLVIFFKSRFRFRTEFCEHAAALVEENHEGSEP